MLPLWDAEPHRRSPVATTLLIAGNLAVFGYEAALAMQGPRAIRDFVETYALVPHSLVHVFGELAAGSAMHDGKSMLLTIFTSMFVHGSLAHVVGNCWFLWVFGRNVESRLGSGRFALFYFFCGFAASAAQVVSFPSSTIPLLGASGAISGVMGGYLVLYPLSWIYTLVPWFVPVVPLPALVFLVVWFAFQAIPGVGLLLNSEEVIQGIAWWAHIGGFCSGVALAALAKKARWIRR